MVHYIEMVLLGEFGHSVLLLSLHVVVRVPTSSSGSKEHTAFIFRVKMKLKALFLVTVGVTDQTARCLPTKLHSVVTYKTTV
jgi:hypothetical protein